MPLEFWTILWKAVFIVGVGLFAVLAVVVAIGGALDIAKLLRILRTRQRADDGHPQSESAGVTKQREQ